MSMLSFALTDDPIEDTIEVSVDGVISSDWSYDVSLNSIVFSTAPGDGSSIDVTYAVWAMCDDVGDTGDTGE